MPIVFSALTLLLLIFFENTIYFNIQLFKYVYVVISSILLIDIIIKIKRRRISSWPYIIVLSGIFFWYLLPAFIDSCFYPYNFYHKFGYSFDEYEHSRLLLNIIVFYSLLYFGYSIVVGQKYLMNYWNFKLDESKFVRICIICAIIGLLPIVLSDNSVPEVFLKLLEGRSANKSWDHSSNMASGVSFLLVMAKSLLIGSASCFFLIKVNHKYKNINNIYLLFFILIAFFILLDSGTRSLSIILFLPFILVWAHRRYTFGKPVLIYTSFYLAIFILLFQAQLFFRNGGDIENFDFVKVMNYESNIRPSIDFYSESLLALKLVPSQRDYFYEFDPYIFLTLPIPRVLWPEKPVSEVAAYYTFERWRIDIYRESGNVFPGIIGQYYMSWGMFGPAVIGFVFGILTRFTSFAITVFSTKNDWNFCGLFYSLPIWLLLNYRFVSPGFLVPIVVMFAIFFSSKKNA